MHVAQDSRRFQFWFCIIVCLLASSGCATGSRTVSGVPVTDLKKELESGDIRLTCELPCAFAFGVNSTKMKELHDKALWYELAETVVRIGLCEDLAYYYLGRSAEGLGYIKGARTYYGLANTKTIHKCSGKLCEGFIFPRDIFSALDRLPGSDKIPSIVMNNNANTQTAENDQAITFTSDNTNSTKHDKTILVFGANSDFHNDIEALKNEKISKDSFESDSEYRQRKSRYIDMGRQSKAYRIVLDINNVDNKNDKLVHFDPDKGTINIVLPKISPSRISMYVNGKKTNQQLHYSFVEVEALNKNLSTYTAKNRLGTEIKVLDISKTSYGIAVLSRASSNYYENPGQTFSVRASKEDAKMLLEGGTVALEVIFDHSYPQVDDGKNPYLLTELEESSPSFDMPVHTKNSRYAIPVRLLAVSIQDKEGVEVFRDIGRQIDTKATRDY